MAERSWETSVEELVLIFRDALMKLIPELRRARIPVESVPGVDAWDEISEGLFRHIVVEAIRASLPEREMEDLRLPQYEMEYEDYREFSFIEVVPKSQPGEACRFAFHSFAIAAQGDVDLSTVRCRAVDERGAIVDNQLLSLPVSQVHFRCCYRRPRMIIELDKLEVVL